MQRASSYEYIETYSTFLPSNLRYFFSPLRLEVNRLESNFSFVRCTQFEQKKSRI